MELLSLFLLIHSAGFLISLVKEHLVGEGEVPCFSGSPVRLVMILLARPAAAEYSLQ